MIIVFNWSFELTKFTGPPLRMEEETLETDISKSGQIKTKLSVWTDTTRSKI